MDNVEDIKKYIKIEYGVDPIDLNEGVLRYRAITFERNLPSSIKANSKTNDMWTVSRDGHSVDFYRTEELQRAIDPGGSLLYFIMPEMRN